MVIESNETATNLTYTIEDGTGNITVKKWLDSEGDAPAPGAATEGCGKGSYVKVIGQLRSFRDSRNIVAFEVRPIANMNEVTHHFLSAIHTHLQKTGAGASAAAPVMANSAGAYAAGGQQAAFGFGGGGAADGMSKAQSAVLAFFKSYAEVESGGSVTDCIKMLAGQGIAEAKVRETVENLTEEGHLYSTVDENHYQSTG
jgi:replication factor A2|tara:strand:- start:118 stop:717 length:600 start_codon:yes stop_codon:yes gene_type:complete